MIIGIDIDDTITNTTELVKLIAQKEFHNYHGKTIIPESKYDSFHKKYWKYVEANATLKDNVIETFNYIKSKGHKIYIVTLRGYNHESLSTTKKYLKKNKIPYDKIIGGAYEKGRIAKENNIDLFIDDRSMVIKDLIKYKIPYIKMYKEHDNNYPYTTAYDWYQIEEMLKERKV